MVQTQRKRLSIYKLSEFSKKAFHCWELFLHLNVQWRMKKFFMMTWISYESEGKTLLFCIETTTTLQFFNLQNLSFCSAFELSTFTNLSKWLWLNILYFVLELHPFWWVFHVGLQHFNVSKFHQVVCQAGLSWALTSHCQRSKYPVNGSNKVENLRQATVQAQLWKLICKH